MKKYQTFGNRIVALLIDGLVFVPVFLLGFWMTQASPTDESFLIATLVEIVLGTAYTVLLHWKYGQTLGKMAMKLRVLDVSEVPITFAQVVIRDVVYIIEGTLRIFSILVLFGQGYSYGSELFASFEQYMVIPIVVWVVLDTVVCLKNEKYRALHDMIARTVVVRLDVSDVDVARVYHEPPGPEAYGDLGKSSGRASFVVANRIAIA